MSSNEISLVLQTEELIDGYDYDMIGWNLFIRLADPSKYDSTMNITVQVILDIANQPNPIHISQQLPYSSIIISEVTAALLPLNGTLWLFGKPSETILTDYSVLLAYVPA